MRNTIVYSCCLGAVLILGACGIGVDGMPTPSVDAVSPSHSETRAVSRALPAGVILSDVQLPDGTGKLHSGVAVVSKALVPALGEYLQGVVVDVADSSSAFTHKDEFEARVNDAASAIAEAMSQSASTVAMGLVFKEDQVAGWHGPMRSVRVAEKAALESGGHFTTLTDYFDGLQVTSVGAVDYSQAVTCNSASADGTLTAGSNAIANMKFFTGTPPFGSQIFSTQQVSNPSRTTYSWGTNTFHTLYYVSMTGVTSGTAQVNNTIHCN